MITDSLRTAGYADQLLAQGLWVPENVLLQIPQLGLDDLLFHTRPPVGIAGFRSLPLQFRQHRDACLQSICNIRNMTHRDLLQALACIPNSDGTAEFVALIPGTTTRS